MGCIVLDQCLFRYYSHRCCFRPQKYKNFGYRNNILIFGISIEVQNIRAKWLVRRRRFQRRKSHAVRRAGKHHDNNKNKTFMKTPMRISLTSTRSPQWQRGRRQGCRSWWRAPNGASSIPVCELRSGKRNLVLTLWAYMQNPHPTRHRLGSPRK